MNLGFIVPLTLLASVFMSPEKSNLTLRPSNARGHAEHGWLDSYHTFSFADYYDPEQMGFGTLRVINEDKIAGSKGFGMHPHANMEIITYVISGALEHKDSMGNTGIILPDEVQTMSAGTGIKHSEFNHLKDQETHLLQIWILPEKEGVTPKYGQKSFKDAFKKQNFVLVVSKDGREGSISINQDADIFVGKLKSGEEKKFDIRSGRKVWIQMVKGNLEVNNQELSSGDGLAVTKEKLLNIKAVSNAEFLLFDLK